MALNSVGTPGIIFGLSLVISFKVSIRSKRGKRTISMPWPMLKFITVVMANTWKRGRTPITRSPSRIVCPRHAITCFTLMERLAWLSMAPLGVPVVPPVYCSTAMASVPMAGFR